MRFLTSITPLVSLLPLIHALPSPTSCTTVTPDIARVSEADPVASYLPGFRISQQAGGTNKEDMFVEFNITAGSWGCSLSSFFPAGTPVTTSGAAAPVEIFAVNGPLSRSPHGIDVSWAYCPAPGALVGSTAFESDPNEARTRFVNSFSCTDKMTYRLSIASWYKQAASVEFAQGPGFQHEHRTIGPKMLKSIPHGLRMQKRGGVDGLSESEFEMCSGLTPAKGETILDIIQSVA
ncbi:hypothetical protein BA78_7857 [Aspergillus fumigatus]|nr:hypothetical protein BA78_7857 [Aspergillus fumigatus]